MKKTLKDKLSDKLVNAFLKNKIITALPKKFTKKLTEADKFRKLCESKIKEPIIGYKAGGTGIPLLKKLKEKEPFYASVYKRNFLKSGKKVKINKYSVGIEVEVCFYLKKTFFLSKGITPTTFCLSSAVNASLTKDLFPIKSFFLLNSPSRELS